VGGVESSVKFMSLPRSCIALHCIAHSFYSIPFRAKKAISTRFDSIQINPCSSKHIISFHIISCHFVPFRAISCQKGMAFNKRMHPCDASIGTGTRRSHSVMPHDMVPWHGSMGHQLAMCMDWTGFGSRHVSDGWMDGVLCDGICMRCDAMRSKERMSCHSMSIRSCRKTSMPQKDRHAWMDSCISSVERRGEESKSSSHCTRFNAQVQKGGGRAGAEMHGMACVERAREKREGRMEHGMAWHGMARHGRMTGGE
jgi:hypothetical protein